MYFLNLGVECTMNLISSMHASVAAPLPGQHRIFSSVVYASRENDIDFRSLLSAVLARKYRKDSFQGILEFDIFLLFWVQALPSLLAMLATFQSARLPSLFTFSSANQTRALTSCCATSCTILLLLLPQQGRSNVPHVLISNESILTFVLVSFRFKLTFKSVSKSKSSQPLEEQCIKRGAENWQYNQVSSECRLWKTRFFILCDVMFFVEAAGEIWNWSPLGPVKGHPLAPVPESRWAL